MLGGGGRAGTHPRAGGAAEPEETGEPRLLSDSVAYEEVLEALDLSAGEPTYELLERAFGRFNARVPFETASKILRHAAIADPHEKPRRPETFWSEHLEWGAGGTCFARVAAFHALLANLGFSARRLLGKVEKDFDHAALLVETPRGSALTDVGFPLPALLPWRGGETETARATLRVVPTERGFRVEFDGGVPDGPRALEVFGSPVSEEEFDARWQETFRPDSRFLRVVGLRRLEENRSVAFTRGELRIDDRHSRLRVPLPAPRAARLSEIFGVDREPLERAFQIGGDPDPDVTDAVLTAYLEVAASPDQAFAAVANLEGYRELMAGVAQVVSAEPAGERSFRLDLAAPGSLAGSPDARFSEEVTTDPSARRLAVRRAYANRSHESAYAVEEHSGATYLVRSVTLPGPREDLLRNDSARGRIAGTLAVDLLAWARRLPSPSS